MSCRLVVVLGAVVFLLSGCEGSGPTPTPTIDEDTYRTPPEAYGCEVGDPISNCTWNLPNGVTVGVAVKAPADALRDRQG